MCRYLVNLATPNDKLLGTRKGLYKHLKYLYYPHKNYLQGFHLQCNNLFRFSHTNSKEHFVKKAIEYFAPQLQKGKTDTDWRGLIGEQYDVLKSKHLTVHRTA